MTEEMMDVIIIGGPETLDQRIARGTRYLYALAMAPIVGMTLGLVVVAIAQGLR